MIFRLWLQAILRLAVVFCVYMSGLGLFSRKNPPIRCTYGKSYKETLREWLEEEFGP